MEYEPWITVIPSYNREELLKRTTLPLLKDLLAPIYILVDKDFQYDLDKDRYIQIIVPRGIGNVRNFIRERFEGSRVLMIDDDIESIDKLVVADDGSKSLESIPDLKEWIKNAWSESVKEGASLWGVNLYHNAFFCRHTKTTKICYINGSFTGVNLTKGYPILRTDIDHFEDFDFTIQTYIRDGKVLKFNDVCLKTKCFRKDGGIAEEVGGLSVRKEKALTNGKILVEKYPAYCSLYKKKKFDVWNLKLKAPKVVIPESYCVGC